MDTKKPSICVFCGSSHGARPAFAEAARRLGTLVGERGFSLVFGGGNVGLMGEVARAAHAAGAPVLGVLPSFLRHLEQPMKSAEELVIVPDMQQRKAIMLERSDAFIALPGGLGTFDEIFEVLSTAQLQVHKKPMVLIDSEGYFSTFEPLIARIVREGFAIRSIENFYRVLPTPDAAIEFVSASLGRTPRP
ncbi:MAG: LOG family protein [Rhizomicrobium sp.]